MEEKENSYGGKFGEVLIEKTEEHVPDKGGGPKFEKMSGRANMRRSKGKAENYFAEKCKSLYTTMCDMSNVHVLYTSSRKLKFSIQILSHT